MPNVKANHAKLIDLSHTIEHGLITYKGLPAPIICDFMSREQSRAHYAPGTEFHIGKIEMVANTGTYVDSPFHRYADGKDLSDLALEKLAFLPAVKFSFPGRQSIDASCFRGRNDLAGKAVLVETGWSLEHSAIFRRTLLPDRRCGATAGRLGSYSRRYRLAEYR